MEFYGQTIPEAWERSMEYLLANGRSVDSQRGMRTLELTNVVFHISDPLAEPQVSDKYGFSSTFIQSFIKGMEDGFLGKSVGERIYRHGLSNVDQLNAVVEVLKRDSFSRRAVIDLWLPEQDSGSLHPPCPVVFQFLIRSQLLNMTCILRSNDAWTAAIPDMIAFSSLQSRVSQLVDVKMGTYTQISVSYHLYEKDLILAKEAFKT